jgi:hypothetical protein
MELLAADRYTSYRTTTAVLYGTGAPASASKIATAFGTTAAASASVASGHVEVLLGAGFTVPDISAPAVPATAAKASAPAVVMPTKGPQGGAVGADSGIPCVN